MTDLKNENDKKPIEDDKKPIEDDKKPIEDDKKPIECDPIEEIKQVTKKNPKRVEGGRISAMKRKVLKQLKNQTVTPTENEEVIQTDTHTPSRYKHKHNLLYVGGAVCCLFIGLATYTYYSQPEPVKNKVVSFVTQDDNILSDRDMD